ncbi:hypothetical protein Halar_0198 (plasmid) [halophilic archaeon DL31]|nr:hypothetical protein Halar_0198 [halophilic archaeon DL31]
MLSECMDRLLSRTDQTGVVYECRRCGTSVDSDDTTCPACGADAIIQHQIS